LLGLSLLAILGVGNLWLIICRLKWKLDEAKEMLDLGANVDWDWVRYDVEGVYIDIPDVCEARWVDREMEERGDTAPSW
jgi:hypothetical protein